MSRSKEVAVWVTTYLVVFTLIASMLVCQHNLPAYITSIINLLLFISILLPTSLVSAAGLCASFLALLLTHRRMKGRKLRTTYFLPHPAIVSVYLASNSFFYHATDTAWWGWIAAGAVSYLTLVVLSEVVSCFLEKIRAKHAI